MRITSITISCLGAALAVACVHDHPATQPGAQVQLQQAQSDSEQAYGSARSAQKEARQKSEEAAQARRDAQQKQLEAQNADERANRLQQEAHIAQQQAIIAGRQAEQRAHAAQERAVELQPRAEKQLEDAAPVSTISGTVQSVSSEELVLVRPGGTAMRIRIDPQQTSSIRAGRTALMSDVRQGESVTVSYRIIDSEPVAQIVAQGPDQGGAPNAP